MNLIQQTLPPRARYGSTYGFTWFEMTEDGFKGMSRNIQYDAAGNKISDITRPTGINIIIEPPQQRTLLQRIFS